MLLLRHGVFYRIYEELIALAPPLMSSSDEGRNTSPLSFATGLWSLLFLSLSLSCQYILMVWDQLSDYVNKYLFYDARHYL